jgi:hypothetical protein
MRMKTMETYEWKYTDDYAEQCTVIEVEGARIRVSRVRDDECGFSFLMENYEYLDVEIDPRCNLADADELDALYNDGDIDEDEHLQLSADEYYMISAPGWHATDMLINIRQSARNYMKMCGGDDIDLATGVVKEAIGRIEDYMYDYWSYEHLRAELIDTDEAETETLGGIESYVFDESAHARYANELVEEIAGNLMYAYKTKYNYKQMLLDLT